MGNARSRALRYRTRPWAATARPGRSAVPRGEIEQHPRFRVSESRTLRRSIVTAAILAATVIAVNGIELAARHPDQRALFAVGGTTETLVMLAVAYGARRVPRGWLEPLAAFIGYAVLVAMMIVAIVVYHGIDNRAYNPTYIAMTPVAVALLVPWRTRTHTRWLTGYVTAVGVYMLVQLGATLGSVELRNTVVAVAVGALLSYFGNRWLYRARLEVFGQELRLRAQRAELARLNRDIARSALTDALTGVPNRRSLDEELEHLWNRVVRYGHSYAALMIDLDRFKPINDRLGHAAGDATLRAVAQALHGLMRTGDGLYRFGGEEFVALLPVDGLADARSAAERFKGAVAALGIANPDNPPWGLLTVSIGVAIARPTVDTDSAAWFARADAALYRAKESGRNRVECDAAGEPRTEASRTADRQASDAA